MSTKSTKATTFDETTAGEADAAVSNEVERSDTPSPAKSAATIIAESIKHATLEQLETYIAAVTPAHINPSTIFVSPSYMPLMSRLVSDVDAGMTGSADRLMRFTKALFGHLF